MARRHFPPYKAYHGERWHFWQALRSSTTRTGILWGDLITNGRCRMNGCMRGRTLGPCFYVCMPFLGNWKCWSSVVFKFKGVVIVLDEKLSEVKLWRSVCMYVWKGFGASLKDFGLQGAYILSIPCFAWFSQWDDFPRSFEEDKAPWDPMLRPRQPAFDMESDYIDISNLPPPQLIRQTAFSYGEECCYENLYLRDAQSSAPIP